MKEITLGIRVNQEISDELKEVAKTLDVPFSQIAREAIREKLELLHRTHPLLQPKVESTVNA